MTLQEYWQHRKKLEKEYFRLCMVGMDIYKLADKIRDPTEELQLQDLLKEEEKLLLKTI